MKIKDSRKIMSDLQIIKDILKNTATIARKNEFTYISRLFPEFSENSKILLVCRNKTLSPTFHHETTILQNEFMEVTEHDVTGSPLRHSFGDDTLDVTIIGKKRNWCKNEENQLPLKKLEASTLLNLCLEHLNKKWSAPLFVLCDGTDAENTILLGAFVDSGQFTTMKVYASGMLESSKIHDCASLMQEHLKRCSVPEHKVDVTISSTYEFHGSNQVTADRSGREKKNFDGYLGLELSWNTLTFLPPARTTSNYLVAQIMTGRKESPLSELWNQLSLLDRYLIIFETYRDSNLSSRYGVFPLTFPNNFETPYSQKSEQLSDKLNLLLSGEHDFDNDNFDPNDKFLFENGTDLENNALLRDHLKELSSRQNLDFTDKLWRCIIGSSNYAQMTDCLHTVFEEIVNNRYTPQWNEGRSTRFADLMNDAISQNSGVPSLAGSLPLELVIDMGIEKMYRDYKYLLLSSNLMDSQDIRDKLSNVSTEEFSADNCRKNLLAMARIHICLEFLLLAQNNLDCSLGASYSFFNHAMKRYTSNESPIKSFANLIDDTIYTLKVPGMSAVLKEVAKTTPSSWRAILSSAGTASKLVTTTHYALSSIFPPNIYSSVDTSEGEELFHVTNAVSSIYTIHRRD